MRAPTAPQDNQHRRTLDTIARLVGGVEAVPGQVPAQRLVRLAVDERDDGVPGSPGTPDGHRWDMLLFGLSLLGRLTRAGESRYRLVQRLQEVRYLGDVGSSVRVL